MSKTVLPAVTFVHAGGTLGSLGADRLDYTDYGDTKTRLSAAQLIGTCPEVHTLARVTAVDHRTGGSRTLVPEHWLGLLALVEQTLSARKCEGVVIGHGTNSLEETAYFLGLTLGETRPVVITGAMRPPNTLASDAQLNLLNGFRVATDPASWGRGVLVCMDGRVLAADDATKFTTYGLDSFKSRDWGPLGTVAADGKIGWSTGSRPIMPSAAAFLPHVDELARVDIVMSYVGADSAPIEAAEAAGARGVVCAGTGAGVVTLAEEAALTRASAKGMVVCLSTRVSAGTVLRTASMTRLGFVAAGRLPPWKARILLVLALGVTSDPERIQKIFDRHQT